MNHKISGNQHDAMQVNYALQVFAGAIDELTKDNIGVAAISAGALTTFVQLVTAKIVLAGGSHADLKAALDQSYKSAEPFAEQVFLSMTQDNETQIAKVG